MATVNSLALNEKLAQVNLQVKAELSRLVRKEDTRLFESMTPDMYPELVKQTWYGLFDPKKGVAERREHHSVIKNILEIYGRNDPMIVLESTGVSKSLEFKIEDVHLTLSKIGTERRLVVPIMTGGIIPGAFVCDCLKNRDMLIDVAFVGYEESGLRNPAVTDLERCTYRNGTRRTCGSTGASPSWWSTMRSRAAGR